MVLVTRQCVPNSLLKTWRPLASTSGNKPTALDEGSDSDIEYGSFESDGAEISSPIISGPVALPGSTQPALTVTVGHHRDESEVISISGKKSIYISKSMFNFSIR
jgi:hypothetical protein